MPRRSQQAQTAPKSGKSGESSGSGPPPLVVVLLAAAAGIVVDRLLYFPLLLWILLTTAFLIAWLALWASRLDRGAAIFLLASTAGVFGIHHHWWWRYFPGNHVSFFASPRSPQVCLRGLVVEEPRVRPPMPATPLAFGEGLPSTVVGLEAQSLRDGATWRKVSGYVTLLIDGEHRGLRAGDVVEVYGLLFRGRPPANPGETDTSARWRAHRRLCVLRAPFPACVRQVGRDRSWDLRLLLAQWRGYHDRVLERYLAGQSRGVVSALLLGIREGIDWQVTSSLMETGLIHFLAISGLHVGLIAGALLAGSGLFLRRWPAAVLATGIGVGVYMLLADAGPSVLRAGTLVLLGSLAALCGRSSWDFNLLGAAGLVVLAVCPSDLFSPGAHLSFLGATALMWFNRSPLAPRQPTPVEWLTVRPGRIAFYTSSIRKAATNVFLVSLWLSLITGPYIAWIFHIVSLIGPVVTLFMWPAVVTAMVTGAGILIFDAVFPPLAWLLATVCTLAAEACVFLARTCRQIPGAYFWGPGPPQWWLVGFYGLLGAIASVRYLRQKQRATFLIVLWIIAGLGRAGLFSREREFRCTFLSVGHGLLVVIQAPNCPAILYDAGSMRHPAEAGARVSQALWALGVRHIGAVVLSHGDRDHYNLLPEIARRFRVDKIFAPPQLARHLEHQSSPGQIDAGQLKTEENAYQIRSAGLWSPVDSFRWAGLLPEMSVAIAGTVADADGSTLYPQPEVGVDALRHFLAKSGIPVYPLAEGQSITDASGQLVLRALAPAELPEGSAPTAAPAVHDNANSLVLLVQYEGLQVLLTGDVEPPGTNRLLALEPVRCHVLLAPHHGSQSSNPRGLLEWASPDVVVISGGARWFRPEVLLAYGRQGAKVLHTRLHGAVQVLWQYPPKPRPRKGLSGKSAPRNEGRQIGIPFCRRVESFSAGRWTLRLTTCPNPQEELLR